MQVFCLDIGGTGTRASLFSPSGEVLARSEGLGGALSLGVERTEDAIRHAWQAVSALAGSSAEPAPQTRLAAGIAGKGLPGRTEALAARLADFAAVDIVGDGYGMLLGATDGKPGALISVGTGVTALRLDATGETLALSGWGFPAGDLGSGAWLGLKATGLLTKYLDGVALKPPMSADLARRIMGIAGTTADAIMGWQTGAKPRDFAALAPFLVEYANKGDAFGLQLLSEAAREIADLATALYPSGRGEISLAGGLGAILLPFCQQQAGGFAWAICTGDPTRGLFLLSIGAAPPERLTPRPGLAVPA